jgi:signal peptidase I
MAAVIGRRPLHTLVRLVVLVIVTIVVFRTMLIPTRVKGISMLPNYHEGQVKFINRLAYAKSDPRRGDVALIRRAKNQVFLLKRVIGLPGEEISIRGGIVYIDGSQLDEPYLFPDVAAWRWSATLGPNEFLLIGDNRSMPQDLHEWGVFDRSRIAGRAIR